MNIFAGLAGFDTSISDREARLRQALGSQSDTTILHPADGISFGWVGDAALSAFKQNGSRFAAAHGQAYGIGGACNVRLGQTDQLAEALVRHPPSVPDLQLVVGAYIAATGDGNGSFRLQGDPSGGRAPYFCANGHELAFATHPLVCAQLLNQPTVDRGLEDFLLSYGFLPDGKTVYAGVTQLPLGKVLVQGAEGWAFEPLPSGIEKRSFDPPASRTQLLDQLHEVMLACTRDQLNECEEVGVLLGGFDSALVAALLHKLGKRVRTYSFRYAESQYNQPHTDSLAHHLGCQHTWVDITPEVVAAGLESYGKSYVQPTNWPNYVIQTTQVGRRMVEDGLTQAYSGDGCDALFLGYPGTYKRTRAYAALPHIPPRIAQSLAAALESRALDRWLGHPYRVAMNLVRASGRPHPARSFLTFRILDDVSLRGLRSNDSPPQGESIESIVQRLAEPHAGLSLQRMGYASKALVSPNRAKMLGCTDVAGIGVVAPYMHPEMRRFTSTIPDELLRSAGPARLADPGKICLMEMASRHQLLPEEVIRQPKLAAIDSPIDDWFEGPLRDTLETCLQALPFEADPRHLSAMAKRTWAERAYKQHVGSTRVISDAAALLATYASACSALQKTT